MKDLPIESKVQIEHSLKTILTVRLIDGYWGQIVLDGDSAECFNILNEDRRRMVKVNFNTEENPPYLAWNKLKRMVEMLDELINKTIHEEEYITQKVSELEKRDEENK